MAERAAVNRAVVGSSPTEAAIIYCRVDESGKSSVSETEVMQVRDLPRQPLTSLGSRRRWQSHLILDQALAGSIPASPVLSFMADVSIFAPVAQLEEAATSKVVCCVSSNLTRSTKVSSCGAIGRRGRLKICF